MQGTPSPESPLQVHREEAVALFAAPGAVPPEGLGDLVRLPDILRGLSGQPSRAAGKPTVWRWSPSWSRDRRLVVRQFVHGGLMGGLLGAWFLSSRSMLRELRIALKARQAGVPTCRPVALRLERVAGPLLSAHYVTEEVPGALNLLECCRAIVGGAKMSPYERQHLSRLVAGTLAALHDAGIDHGDLNLKNLLVADRNGAREVLVIDFKKARLQNHVSLGRRLRSLVRLDRSIVKWPESRHSVTVSDRLRTLREYLKLQGDLRDSWKDVARRIRTRHLAHAMDRK